MDERLKRHWAANIRFARRTRRMSQQELAAACGVDQSTVSRWERHAAIPTEDNKVTIAKAFGLEDPRVLFPLVIPDGAVLEDNEPVGAAS